MTFTERLMGVGGWSLNLDPGTPTTIRNLLLPGVSSRGHVVVTSNWADLSQLEDADALALARYVGIFLDRDESGLQISGYGVNALLGDGQRGPSTGPGTATATFADWAAACTPTFLGTGIRSSIAGNFKLTREACFWRDVADKVAARYDAAWRVTNDFKLDFGTYADLFRDTPVALIVRHREDAGRDFGVRGVTGDLNMVRETKDTARRVVYWWDDDGTPTAVLQDGGVDAADYPFRGPDGSAAFVDAIVTSNTDNLTDATALSLAELGKIAGVRNEITLRADEYDIGRDIQVGDNVHVYDHKRGIYDLNNPVVYRGQTIYPTVIRCVGYTWPFREGMGCWFRRYRKVDSSWVLEWTDLTRYVLPESGDTTVEVGAKPRTLGGR